MGKCRKSIIHASPLILATMSGKLAGRRNSFTLFNYIEVETPKPRITSAVFKNLRSYFIFLRGKQVNIIPKKINHRSS